MQVDNNSDTDDLIEEIVYVDDAGSNNNSNTVETVCSNQVDNNSDTDDLIEEIVYVDDAGSNNNSNTVETVCSNQVDNNSDTDDLIEEIVYVDDAGSNNNSNTVETVCSNQVDNNSDSDLKSIKLPSKIKISGRPKGISKTTIGLLKKKKGLPISFRMQSTEKKQKLLLKWIVTDQSIVTKALNNKYIIDDIDKLCQQDQIHSGILEEDVELDIVKCFFSNQMWKSLLNRIKIKRKEVVWICPTCKKGIGLQQSILCDCCLTWFHMKCDINIKPKPKRADWFCSECCKKKL